MNLEVKAAAIVAGIVVSSVIGILIVKLAFTYIPLNVLAMFGAIVVFGFMLSLLYTIVINRLKYEAKIKEMVKK